MRSGYRRCPIRLLRATVYEYIYAEIYWLCENNWTDARRPVPRLWIRSAEVRGERRWENGNTTTTLRKYRISSVGQYSIFLVYLRSLLSEFSCERYTPGVNYKNVNVCHIIANENELLDTPSNALFIPTIYLPLFCQKTLFIYITMFVYDMP